MLFQESGKRLCRYTIQLEFVERLALRRFATQLPGQRYEPALGEGTLCGLFVETDDATGLAKRCEPIRVGGKLSELLPDL